MIEISSTKLLYIFRLVKIFLARQRQHAKAEKR